MKKTIARAAAFAGALMPFVARAQEEESVDFGLSYGRGSTALGTQDVRTTIFEIIDVLLSFLGIVAILIILYGGWTWMTSQGNEEKTGSARKMIIAGAVGLVIIFSAFALTEFVLREAFTATGGRTENLGPAAE